MAERLTSPGLAEAGRTAAPSAAGSALPEQLKEMIVRVLMLEGVAPAVIADDAALFGEGLGLDSVDALELAIHVEEEFGVKIPDDASSRSVFRSVATLTAYIHQARATSGA